MQNAIILFPIRPVLYPVPTGSDQFDMAFNGLLTIVGKKC